MAPAVTTRLYGRGAGSAPGAPGACGRSESPCWPAIAEVGAPGRGALAPAVFGARGAGAVVGAGARHAENSVSAARVAMGDRENVERDIWASCVGV